MPESTHMLMWVMSDRAIPRSYRMMQGFGVHTFRLVNAAGRVGVLQVPLEPGRRHALAGLGRGGQDLRRRPRLPPPRPVGGDRGGRLSRVRAAAAGLHRGAGRALQLRRPRRDQDRARGAGAAAPGRPDGARTAIPTTSSPRPSRWRSAPRTSCPGIDFSNDPLLQGRIHSYLDTQITRLGGPNFHEIPINSPVAQVHNNQRDGMHRQAIHRGRVAYEPNSLGGGCPFQAGVGGGFVSFPRAGSSERTRCAASRRSSPTTTRRPAVLRQPDAGRAGAHHRRVPLRADAGCRPRRSASAWCRCSPTSTPALARGVADGPRHRRSARADAARARASPSRRYEPSPALSLMARPGDGTLQDRAVAMFVAAGRRAELAAGRSTQRWWRGRGAALRRPAPRRLAVRDRASRCTSTPRWRRCRRCCSTAWSCRTARRASTTRRSRPRGRVRAEPVPPLQADPGHRCRCFAAAEGRDPTAPSRRRSRSGRHPRSSQRCRRFHGRAGAAPALRAGNRSAHDLIGSRAAEPSTAAPASGPEGWAERPARSRRQPRPAGLRPLLHQFRLALRELLAPERRGPSLPCGTSGTSRLPLPARDGRCTRPAP